MKKMIAIVLALMLCVTALSVTAFAAEGDTVTVNVQVPEGTATPKLWAWGDYGNAFSTWPGDEMTANGEWYAIEVPVGTTGLIVNTDGDTDKSADITVDGDKDVWVVCSLVDGHFVADSVSYEAPSAGGETGGENTNPGTGDMNLAAVSIALMAATAGLVVLGKKKEF